MDWIAIAGVVVIAVAVTGVLYGIDVRLVLLLAALTLGAIGGDIPLITRTFFATFSNEKFVVPICSAMGFAYVLKYTGCDEHLIRLLIEPVRRVRFLMVPGVVLIGFIVNIPVISQTSTAVCLGTVVVPLMRAAGFTPITIASALVLGCSVGGELLNPGAPELLTISDTVFKATQERISTRSMVGEILPVVLPVLGVSMLVHWGLCLRASSTPLASGEVGPEAREKESPLPQPSPPGQREQNSSRVNLLRALVPLVPLALLFTSGPPFNLFALPMEWVSDDGKMASSRLIGLAMLIGVGVAALAVPSRAKGCMKSFFEGAGYGFTTIISLIVTANCFGKGIAAVGLAEHLGTFIEETPQLLHPLAGLVPASFGFVCGSGMASTQSLYQFFYEPSVTLNADPVRVGAMVSVGSAIGRTMSPVAAVVLMCATLTGAKPFEIVKRVSVPLLAGLATMIALRLLNVV